MTNSSTQTTRNKQSNLNKLSDLLKNNGFFMENATDGAYKNIAHLSLYKSIFLYFKTADDISKKVREVHFDGNKKDLGKDVVSTDYVIDMCDSILHFQHFIELYIKDILLKVSPLLVYNIKDRYDLQYKMIKGEKISDSDVEGLHFIEGSEAISKLKKVINENSFNSYQFLSSHFDLFEKINNYRNRIAHRGAFVLDYFAFDELFCCHIIPFLNDLKDKDSDYSTILNWRFNLHLKNVDIYDALHNIKFGNSNDKVKAYILKMIAYAAYNNKIRPVDSDNENSFLEHYTKDQIIKAEEIANDLFEGEYCYKSATDIKTCPVCNCKTLMIYEDLFEEEDSLGDIINQESYICGIACKQCGFHLDEPEFIQSLNDEFGIKIQ